MTFIYGSFNCGIIYKMPIQISRLSSPDSVPTNLEEKKCEKLKVHSACSICTKSLKNIQNFIDGHISLKSRNRSAKSTRWQCLKHQILSDSNIFQKGEIMSVKLRAYCWCRKWEFPISLFTGRADSLNLPSGHNEFEIFFCA